MHYVLSLDVRRKKYIPEIQIPTECNPNRKEDSSSVFSNRNANTRSDLNHNHPPLKSDTYH